MRRGPSSCGHAPPATERKKRLKEPNEELESERHAPNGSGARVAETVGPVRMLVSELIGRIFSDLYLLEAPIDIDDCREKAE